MSQQVFLLVTDSSAKSCPIYIVHFARFLCETEKGWATRLKNAVSKFIVKYHTFCYNDCVLLPPERYAKSVGGCYPLCGTSSHKMVVGGIVFVPLVQSELEKIVTESVGHGNDVAMPHKRYGT